jgi:hypothetical protein
MTAGDSKCSLIVFLLIATTLIAVLMQVGVHNMNEAHGKCHYSESDSSATNTSSSTFAQSSPSPFSSTYSPITLKELLTNHSVVISYFNDYADYSPQQNGDDNDDGSLWEPTFTVNETVVVIPKLRGTEIITCTYNETIYTYNIPTYKKACSKAYNTAIACFVIAGWFMMLLVMLGMAMIGVLCYALFYLLCLVPIAIMLICGAILNIPIMFINIAIQLCKRMGMCGASDNIHYYGTADATAAPECQCSSGGSQGNKENMDKIIPIMMSSFTLLTICGGVVVGSIMLIIEGFKNKGTYGDCQNSIKYQKQISDVCNDLHPSYSSCTTFYSTYQAELWFGFFLLCLGISITVGSIISIRDLVRSEFPTETSK